MIAQKIVEQVNQQFSSVIKNNPLQDIEKNIKSIVIAAFAKLDLVTREEFDTQQKVLLATRRRLEDLEEIVKKLSNK